MAGTDRSGLLAKLAQANGIHFSIVKGEALHIGTNNVGYWMGSCYRGNKQLQKGFECYGQLNLISVSL